MKKYLTEFIGTFFWVLTVSLASTQALPLSPVVIGGMLTALVYMGGHVSGAHYNPAVSLALFLRRAVSAADLVPYVVCQLAGAFAASVVAHAVLGGDPFVPAPAAGIRAGQALAVEVLYTFVLALVVLNVATSRRTDTRAFYGLAVGVTLAAATAVGQGVSGAVYNPAVGLGPILYDTMCGGDSFGHVWLYVVGPFAGAAVAPFVFRIQEGAE